MPTNQDAGSSRRRRPRMTRWERLKYAMVKPDDDSRRRAAQPTNDRRRSSEDAIRYADDKERAIGLIVARGRHRRHHHQLGSIQQRQNHHHSTTVFVELTYVLLGLAVLILVSSLLRKRLFQGDHAGALRRWPLPGCASGLRCALRPGRRLVSGPRLPAAAGAQEGRGDGGRSGPAPSGAPLTGHGPERTSATRRRPRRAAYPDGQPRSADCGLVGRSPSRAPDEQQEHRRAPARAARRGG